MPDRFRGFLRFQNGSGMAAWTRDQLNVRMGMAFHLREGQPNQELSFVQTNIITTGPQANRKEDISFNILWPDDRRDLADDTIATLLAVMAWIKPDTIDDNSWMDRHNCKHDLNPPEPCPPREWQWP